mmetsp:Transcript_30777/g.56019  ORF Transcript_30777/g.56019 Transcript_30777/m.56019 type:complete len:176 (-) Transcript_30777:250-777(-)
MATKPVDYSIGSHISIQTKLGEAFKGTIFLYDKPSNLLVLKEEGSHSGVHNIRFLRENAISKVVAISAPEGTVNLDLPSLSHQRVESRMKDALRKAESLANQINDSVSQEAQAIFESLSKTMPCRWEGQSIVVLDTLWIDFPYSISSYRECSDTELVNRVSKMLTNARKTLNLEP